jgi:hypothetical protein
MNLNDYRTTLRLTIRVRIIMAKSPLALFSTNLGNFALTPVLALI